MNRQPRLSPTTPIRWLLVLLLFLLPALGTADLETQLRRAEALRAQRAAQAEALRRELANLDQQSKALLSDLERLSRELGELERARHATLVRIEENRRALSALEAKIDRETARLETLKRQLSRLMVSLWEKRAGRYLPLLKARSFTELAVRSRWLATLGQADLELAREVVALTEALHQEAKKRQALLDRLAHDEAVLRQKRAAVAKKKAEVQQKIKVLEKNKKAKRLKLSELVRTQAALEKEIASLKSRIEAQRRQAAQKKTRVPRVLVGELLFPVDGGRIAQKYGENAQDFEWIEAPKAAAAVRAAAGGQVFATLYYGNVGWTVMIQHSETLFTQYVNLQEPLVKTGDRVEQGEIIGYLGGGALIPPNVLWFRVAVWKNDTFNYVDPEPYY